jgi:NAD(P)-dependent dehydrogenase (short-subunit alcohol dehydrogenase family)
MKKQLNGKVVLIVGGNSGIGLACAQAFAEAGARLVITGRNPETLKKAADDIGHGAITVEFDMGRLQQIEPLMREVRRHHDSLDVLFINAGVGAFVPIEDATEEQWDEIANVNVKGVFFTIQRALPLLRRGSSILLTSSIGWKKSIPGSAIYAASKAGVHALGRALAGELAGRGIRVNVISPGPVDTPIINRTMGLPPEAIAGAVSAMVHNTLMKRMGRPEEIAAAALFLASDGASFITGADLSVDGGASSS